MTEPTTNLHTSEPLPPESVSVLLESAQRARKNGKIVAARALLRALVAQQPEAPQVWLELAIVAETPIEQRRAFEQVVALDPYNTLAQHRLEELNSQPTTAGTLATTTRDRYIAPNHQPINDQPVLVAVDAHATPADLPKLEGVETAPGPRLTAVGPAIEHPTNPIRWPLYLILGIALLVVLASAFLIYRPVLVSNNESNVPTPSPSLFGAATAIPRADAVTSQITQPTLAPMQIEDMIASPLPTAINKPTPATPTIPALSPGMIVQQGQWHAILIRPQDVVALDGGIGTLQPKGRFVLALVAVGNDGTEPAQLPSDLFSVVDSTNQRYTARAAVSTAYLNIYGRGQHGDLSMEDPIPADGSNKSIPLIFDIPTSARDLHLMVGNKPQGWAILQ